MAQTPRTEITVAPRTLLRVLTIITIFMLGLGILWVLRAQITWVAIAFFLALALTPAVNWLARFMPRKSRGLAMAIVLIITIAIFAYLIFVLVPPVIDQLIKLVQNFPQYWDSFIHSNATIERWIGDQNFSQLAARNQDKINAVASNAGSWIGSAASGIFGLITIFTLTFFMVIEGPKWQASFWRWQTPARRKQRQAIAEDMYRTVTGYVTGNVITSFVATVVTTIFLWIMGVPSPLALGILVGVLDLVPMIGATLAAVVVSLFALVYNGTGAGIATVAFFIIYQQVENNVLQPLVFAKSVQISPLVVGIAALFGASLAGFFGALVAIPVAASLQILVKHVLANRDELLSRT